MGKKRRQRELIQASCEKDLKALEDKVKEYVGEEVFEQLTRYSFDFCQEEADMMMIPYSSKDFVDLCKARRMSMLSNIAVIYIAATDIPVKVQVEMFSPDKIRDYICMIHNIPKEDYEK